MAKYKWTASVSRQLSYKVALYLQCAGSTGSRCPSTSSTGRRAIQVARGRQRDGRGARAGDGATKLAQSGVILTYLSDKTGKFKPAGEAQRLEALRWMLFDNHKFTGYFATYRFMKAFLKQEPISPSWPSSRAASTARLPSRSTSAKPGSSPGTSPPSPTSPAGRLHVLPARGERLRGPKSNPSLAAWIERMRALPGWKDPEPGAGQRIKPLR